jgi:hypothetical protein
MLQFLSSYPWRYYLNTFFRKGHPARGVLLVKEDRVSILSPVGGKLVFSSGLRELKGAPSLTNSSRAGPDTAFRREALADRSVNHSFEWIFVVDLPDMQIHQIDSLRYGSTRELTSRRVMELVPSVLKADLADWELVNSKLESIEKDTTPVCILLGLPKSVIKNLEGWSRQLRSTVSAILPLSLVLLEQSITLSPTGFQVVLTTNHTVIALTQEGEIRLITRVDPIERLGATQIDAIVRSFGDTFPGARERRQGLLNPCGINQSFGVFGSRGDHSGVSGRPDRGVCPLPGSLPRGSESLPLNIDGCLRSIYQPKRAEPTALP